ncbi:MAG: hypothetical protein FWE69_03085 [Clostridiales bacterium]|nr:hypothetical protein [Clostridiales bacterium]
MINNYYKRKCFGRNALARALDLALLGVILYLAFYLLLFTRPAKQWLAPLLALLATGCFFCLSRLRLIHFTRRERERLQNLVWRDELLLMPETELRALLGQDETILLLQQERPATVDDLLPILRGAGEGAALFLTTTLTEEAKGFLARNASGLIIHELAALLDRATLSLMSETREKEVIASLSPKPKLHNYLRKISIFNGGWKKYLGLGIVLLALSIFIKPVIYYRLLSSLCFFISGTGLILRNKNTNYMNNYETNH